ncbi:MAG: type IV pilus assembly protein PilM [Candidatus Levybacteria bacterium]|nr:type IV pilus assembly protein PilM [Candidatus Levybacteria bacterium]
MGKKSIGLDIGLTNIKAVSLSRQKEGFFLNSAFSIPTPPRGMFSESPLDQENIAKAIKKVVSNLKADSKNVNVALDDTQVYTKVIDMPALSDRELALAIHWEAEQNIPVSLSDITLVWNVLKKPPKESKDEKMRVLLVGAPTTLIKKYQNIIEASGLNLYAIETEILSVVRALSYSGLPPTIILSIGAISTSLAIVKDNILVFTYSIPTGGNAISRAISSDFGLTLSQSEAYKKAYGLSKEGMGQKVGKSTELILTSILGEVKKTLAFYSEKYHDDSLIQQILLSGGTARLPGIDLFFAENLGIETALANPWKILASQVVPQEIVSSASDFTIAVGLAMRDL